MQHGSLNPIFSQPSRDREGAVPTLSLHFSTEKNHTSLRVLRQDPPWRALRAFSNASGEALVHLHNVSGGVLGGDSLKLEVTLAPGAQAQVTNIGATRVYRHRTNQPDASHTAIFRIANGALLEYLPEPLIPFALSRFSQTSEIHLADGAGLIWWETLSAGRIAHGESFDFENVSVNTAIHSQNELIALERYSISPKLRNVASPARMGPFLYSATMYVCRADGSARWLGLESELNIIASELSGPETLWGVSALVRHGVVVRGMAKHAHQVNAGLLRLWRTAKQSVWERPALPPRKIN
jgi:urease accessory protein